MDAPRYQLVLDPEVEARINSLAPHRKAAVLKAAGVLTENPFTEFSIPVGDDETIRVVDLTPHVRVRYIVRESQVYVFVYHLTDFREPLMRNEGEG